jgi:hypothetical protein
MVATPAFLPTSSHHQPAAALSLKTRQNQSTSRDISAEWLL